MCLRHYEKFSCAKVPNSKLSFLTSKKLTLSKVKPKYRTTYNKWEEVGLRYMKAWNLFNSFLKATEY